MNRLALFFIFSLSGSLAYSQQELMSGMVVDSATFVPLGYAGVQVKNTLRGTITDAKGKFHIMATRQDTLLFSMLGYKTLEVSLHDWETNVVRLPEQSTMLQGITIEETRLQNPYDDLFSEEYAKWKESRKKLPFYYSQWKKQKIKLGRAQQEEMRVRTYVDLVVKNETTKEMLMKKHHLSEAEYFKILTRFNEKSHTFMYYLTAPELLSLLNSFFESESE